MITYYTPNFSGFNAGFSYAFDEKQTRYCDQRRRYIGGYVATTTAP
jgi:predicted porin